MSPTDHGPRSPGPSCRNVWFLTGTRADYGKLKPLILGAAELPGFSVTVIATGMHLLERYGSTVIEVQRLPSHVRVLTMANQEPGDQMDRAMARTIDGLSALFDRSCPDLFVVHGDRIEPLAGAIVGALRNVPVAHIEGGELSGTIDGVLRHAISKMAHLHLVANAEAARRVIQLGESPDSVWVIGSPDIDIMMSEALPPLAEVRAAYEIGFDDYGMLIFHAVTTEDEATTRRSVEALVDIAHQIELPLVVVYPNNDPGSEAIIEAYDRFADNDRFRVFPSLRFEAFLTLLRHARIVIGNSSAGIREAPVYGVPSVNIGSRQQGRHHHPTIVDTDSSAAGMAAGITAALKLPRGAPSTHFGRGDSARQFRELLAGADIWRRCVDKRFRDLVIEDN